MKNLLCFRSLDSQLSRTVGRILQFGTYRIMAYAPIPILVDITGVYDQQIFLRLVMIYQKVIHDTSLVVREASILSLAKRQDRSVIRSYALNESQGVRAFYPKLAHVGNIEHTYTIHYSHVFVDNSGIFDRHIETCEFVHLRAQGDMHVGKRSCFHVIIAFKIYEPIAL